MRRVVKVGGSLLLRDDLPAALPRWLATQSEAETLIVVGGGELIDAVRRLDQIRSGDSIEIHWLCVELLETTRQLFAQWFDWPSVCTADELDAASESGFSRQLPTLVAVKAFYGRRLVGHQRVAMPLDWRTTTDAIAALLAMRTRADELVLLKSCDVDPRASIEQLAIDRVVDEALPMVASQVKRVLVEKLI